MRWISALQRVPNEYFNVWQVPQSVSASPAWASLPTLVCLGYNVDRVVLFLKLLRVTFTAGDAPLHAIYQ